MKLYSLLVSPFWGPIPGLDALPRALSGGLSHPRQAQKLLPFFDA